MRSSYSLFIALSFALLLGAAPMAPAAAAELDGFALQTSDDNAVKVILYTQGGRVDYQTEMSDSGMAIVLRGARLSPRAAQNGLPVVRDNHNRLIGQIAPDPANAAGQSGDLRIRIPNVSARQYAVSVIQKPASEAPASTTAPALTAVTALTPQTLNDPAFKSQFETITSGFAPTPVRYFSFGGPAGGATTYGASQRATSPRQYFPEWRPERSFLNNAPRGAGVFRPRSSASAGASARKAAAIIPESFGALALGPPARAAVQGRQGSSASPAASSSEDSETALPALPAPAPDAVSATTSDAATSDAAAEGKRLETAAASAPASSASSSGFSLSRAPWWTIALAALFFGGIGLFALTAGLLLFRFLVRPTSPRVILQTQGADGALSGVTLLRSHAPSDRPLDAAAPAKAIWETSAEGASLSSSSAAPAAASPLSAAGTATASTASLADPILAFEDAPVAQASDYWLPAAGSPQEAVRQSARLKSAAGRRRGNVRPASPVVAAS